MTKYIRKIAAFSLGLALLTEARSQIVHSGSNGSLGALVATNIGDVLIPLPVDGKLHYTSVFIGQNTTVRFSRNPLNTPVFLLASSNVVIQGRIDVSGTDGGPSRVGSGGPGGFDGGAFGIEAQPGDGEGPGGGRAGFFPGSDQKSGGGSFGSPGRGSSGPLYGNRTLNPLIGGSGGGGMGNEGGRGGGGGGGAILIASDLGIELTGAILANGGIGYVPSTEGRYFGGGSGGAVRLVAPGVAGNGAIDVSRAYIGGDDSGGSGRIRIDAASAPSLYLYGISRLGGNFEVFPPVVPSLRVIEVGGQPVPETAGSTVQITLSRNASPSQTVKLRAQNFSGFVPITVAVIPEQGSSARFLGEIAMGASETAEATVNVVLTPGTVNRIQAWTQ